MSDPKPLRFTQPETDVRSPSWLPPKDGAAAGPQSLQPPRVEVESIRDAAHGAESPIARPVDWQVGAPTRGAASGAQPEPVGPDNGRVQELEQALAALEAQNQDLRSQLEQATQEAARNKGEFSEAAVDLAAARAEVVAAVEKQLLELSVLIAQSLIESEVESRPELHRVLVEAALEHVDGDRKAGVRCSQDAYAAIVDCLGGTQVDVRGVTVTVNVDRELKGLGCIVESDSRRVDGRVSERLSAVRRAFLAENRRLQEEGT